LSDAERSTLAYERRSSVRFSKVFGSSIHRLGAARW
jgi:hypothetical protein